MILTNHKVERINVLLTKLQESLETLKKECHRDDVFFLTVKNATDNAIFLCRTTPNIEEKSLKSSLQSKKYKQIIQVRIGHLPQKRIAALFNMEAFWNGFITDNFSSQIMG